MNMKNMDMNTFFTGSDTIKDFIITTEESKHFKINVT